MFEKNLWLVRISKKYVFWDTLGCTAEVLNLLAKSDSLVILDDNTSLIDNGMDSLHVSCTFVHSGVSVI